MKDRRPTFFTSDWHLGHEKSIEYDRRPFKDIHHMHRVLVNNFNSTVPENGITYFLGDMGNLNTEAMKKIIDELSGTKILIMGNHDKGVEAMYRAGFDAVMYSASLVIASQVVTMSHCPLRGLFREDTSHMRSGVTGEMWHGEKKNGRFSFLDFGQHHLHGHIHSAPWKKHSQKILGKQFDVGVVANDYRPVSISVLESWIATYGR